MEVTVSMLFEVIGRLHVQGIVKDNQIASISNQVEELGKSLAEEKPKKGKKNG